MTIIEITAQQGEQLIILSKDGTKIAYALTILHKQVAIRCTGSKTTGICWDT